MSPFRATFGTMENGFPRVSGDEPQPHNNLPPFYAFSPREWG